jgi:hypothetical protein
MTIWQLANASRSACWGEVNGDAAVPFTLKIEKLEAGKSVSLIMDVVAEASTNISGVIEIKAAW